jgi:hypothetical protein
MHEASATYRVVGGMSGFTQAIAADVAGEIRLGATVTRVAQKADGAVVTCADGTGARGLRPVVLNADSRQVYAGLDIGTSKIKPSQMRGFEHRLLDVAEPSVYADVNTRFGGVSWRSAGQGVLYAGVVGRGCGPGTARCCWRRGPGSSCQLLARGAPASGPQAMMSSLPQFRSEFLEPT